MNVFIFPRYAGAVPDFPFDHPLHQRWKELLLFNGSEELNRILDYSRQISPIKVLRTSSKKVAQQKTRKAILATLEEGLSFDEDEPRHVMSALELQECIGTKLTVIYFHLQKLLESGHITEVAVLSDGRYDTIFYARTGKIYIYIQDVMNEDSFREIFKIMVAPEYQMHLEDFFHERNIAEMEVSKWMDEHPDLLQHCDPAMLFITLLQYHPRVVQHALTEVMGLTISSIFDDSS